MSMFYMPVRVYEEENCVMNHAGDFVQFGKKALLPTAPTRISRPRWTVSASDMSFLMK